MTWIAFIAGLWIGFVLGVVAICLFISGKRIKGDE